MPQTSTIQEAVSDLKKGMMIIVIDDKDRENEGDLVCAAEKVTPEIVNFMIKCGRGLVCVPLTKKTAKRLNLELMSKFKEDNTKCKFTISIDLIKGATTGISAYDRAKTIKALSNVKSKASDFYKPGHVFPILVNDGGVLKRPGHSEASVDLCRLAGFKPIGVICEIIRDDGKMARFNDLLKFSQKFRIKAITIKDLINYLKTKEFY